MGELQRMVRESRAPERFSSYLAMETDIRDSEPSTLRRQQIRMFGGMPWWSMTPS